MKTHLRSSLRTPSALLAMALLAALPLVAQDATGPKAVAPSTSTDLGQVARGDKATTEFLVENDGDEPLTILDSGSNCACGVVSVEPPTIPPGGSAKVIVEIDTEVLEGPAGVNAAILTNDRNNPQIVFNVKLEAKAYLAAKPGFFSYKVHQGFEGSGEIAQTIIAEDPTEFAIVGADSTYPGLSVSYREANAEERLAGFEGPQYVLTAKLDPMAGVGPLTGFVRVRTTHEKQKLFSIPISGFVRPVVAVTPPRVEIDRFRLSEDDERYGVTLRVQHFLAGAEDLEITKIESDIPNLESKLQDGNTARDWYLDLWFTKEDLPEGAFNGTVTLHTTSEVAPIVVVPVKSAQG